jgi:hypothetical protein
MRPPLFATSDRRPRGSYALGQDLACELVVVFHMSFLPEGGEVAAETLCRVHSALITLEGRWIGELQNTEEFITCYLSQHVKGIND